MPNRFLKELPHLEARVLLLPQTKRDGDVVKKVLAENGISCEVLNSSEEFLSQLSQGVGVAVLSEETMSRSWDALATAIRDQPVWSDFPIVVLSKAGAESPALHTILSQVGNISVLERPVRMTTFVSVIRSAMRARVRQFQVRNNLIARENAENALRVSRDQLELVVKGAEVGVWYCPLPFDRLIWDDTVKRHFHLPTNADVTIETFYNGLHPEDRERTRLTIEQSLQNRSRYDITYRTVSASGDNTLWIHAIGGSTCDVEGKPIAFNGITIDITERMLIEERRRQLLEAEQAARSEAERTGRMKDEFLATLSHELRTPLNAILGWTQILKLTPQASPEVSSGVDVIERNARAQAQIIEDLLDMNRITSGKLRLDLQQINLCEVINAAIETVRPAAIGKDIRIQSILDSTHCLINGDASRLQQVFWNLLSNAVKFTPKLGKIQVVLEQVHSHLEIHISDNGDGIDSEFLPHVFNRFIQADPSSTRRHGGLGLGLSIVKQLIELHGGSVSAASEGAGKGTTFTVCLPQSNILYPQSTDSSTQTESPSTLSEVTHVPVNLEGLTILVVDDEADARAMMDRLLSNFHATVVCAGSVKEAIAALNQQHIDLLISDIGMPEENGFTLISYIRNSSARLKSLPAIALTAYARKEDRVAMLKAGFQAHLAKPIEPAELLATAHSLCPNN